MHIQSMTGFGKATIETPNISVNVEIKTLNSKFTDIFCRMPRNLQHREIEVRNLIVQELERGKIEITVTVQKTGDVAPSVSVNRPLIQAYISDLKASASSLVDVSEMELFKLALLMPNAYNTDNQPETQANEEWDVVLQTIKKAIEACQGFRKDDGKGLALKFGEYVSNIQQKLIQISEIDQHRIPAVRERIRKNITDLLGDETFDKNRFEQELIYYIEKFDISEEKVRLQTHLHYFNEVLRKETNGKKLNFISQEMGREINTIGSKANDATIQRFVVEMKDELEKIKEQTMNIL